MPRLQISPQALNAEAAALRGKLAAGYDNLRGIGAAPAAGGSPRHRVWHCERVVLYKYDAPPVAADSGRERTPLLIVYALVNRPEMTDLEPGRSLIETLTRKGFEVYLLDWGYPGQADSHLGLEDYVLRYIDGAVDFLRRDCKRDRIPVLGICQGGTFSTCYATLEPAKVEHLVTTVTPIDFQTPGDLLSRFVRHVDPARIFGRGNLHGDVLNLLFLALKPNRLLFGKYLGLIDMLDDPAAVRTFLRMERWIFDSPAIPQRVAVEFMQRFYLDNALVEDRLEIGGRPVRLSALSMPVTNIYAASDHLVPPPASRALGSFMAGRDYHEAALPGGHIGLYVGARARDTLATLVDGRVRTSGR